MLWGGTVDVIVGMHEDARIMLVGLSLRCPFLVVVPTQRLGHAGNNVRKTRYGLAPNTGAVQPEARRHSVCASGWKACWAQAASTQLRAENSP